MYRNKTSPPYRARVHGRQNDRPRPGDGPHLRCYRCSCHRITQDGRCTICGRFDRIERCTGPSRWWHGQSLLMALMDVPAGDVFHNGCSLCDRAEPHASKGPRVNRPQHTLAERYKKPQRLPIGEPWLWSDAEASAWLALASRADKIHVINVMRRHMQAERKRP